MTDKERLPTYRLTIGSRIDERDRKPLTVFTLETMREFTSFQYDLVVRELFTGDALRFAITGLTPPDISMRRGGPARYSRELSDLNGTYDITVEGLDKKEETFAVRINGRSIELLHAPPRSFVQVMISNTEQE